MAERATASSPTHAHARARRPGALDRRRQRSAAELAGCEAASNRRRRRSTPPPSWSFSSRPSSKLNAARIGPDRPCEPYAQAASARSEAKSSPSRYPIWGSSMPCSPSRLASAPSGGGRSSDLLMSPGAKNDAIASSACSALRVSPASPCSSSHTAHPLNWGQGASSKNRATDAGSSGSVSPRTSALASRLQGPTPSRSAETRASADNVGHAQSTACSACSDASSSPASAAVAIRDCASVSRSLAPATRSPAARAATRSAFGIRLKQLDWALLDRDDR